MRCQRKAIITIGAEKYVLVGAFTGGLGIIRVFEPGLDQPSPVPIFGPGLYRASQRRLSCATFAIEKSLPAKRRFMMEVLDASSLAERLKWEAEEYWLHLEADSPLEKYPGEINLVLKRT